MSEEEQWLSEQIQLANREEYCLDFACGLHGQGREFFERIIWESSIRVGVGLNPFERHSGRPTLDDIPAHARRPVVNEVIRGLRSVEFEGASEYQRQAVRVMIFHLHRSDSESICGQTMDELLLGSPSQKALREMQQHFADSRLLRSVSEANRAVQVEKKQERKQERARLHLEREASKKARNE